jgi:DNA-binding transcriptional MerR regulator/methylmalonyl-CoA mutase cobalamin-binding subunit
MKAVRTIKFVARQTGLSVHAIRVWERRYGAVQPTRAENNRRLYSEEDVERLRLLHQATQAGHAIGQIARASAAELRRLLREDLTTRDQVGPAPRGKSRSIADDLLAAALRAVERLDAADLNDLLDRAAVELGSPAVLHKIVAPLAEQVGDRWRAGDLNVAHEHFATAILTGFLNGFARPYPPGKSAPHLVLATPSGQLHELGAIVVAAAARSHGWRATYLGASLPIEEFAGAARSLNPRAVGLSIVFPPDDDLLVADLKKLRKFLPAECAILVGGRSAAAYRTALREIKATRVDQLEHLYATLDKLTHVAH